MNATQQLVQGIVTHVIDPLILILFSGGFFLFLWGMVKYLYKKSSNVDVKDEKMHMLWGVVGMFIMVSVYGILNLLAGTFGLDLSGNVDTSTLNNFGSGSFFR